MNASEINSEIRKTIDRAIIEGVAQNKVAFETIIGILESHKQALYDWRSQAILAAQQAEALAIGRKAPISQATKDFVDGVDPLQKAMSDGQWLACQQMCNDKDIDINALEAYAIEKNYLAQTGPACRRKLGWMTGDYYIKLAAIAGDPIKRRALVGHLKSMEAVK